MFEHVTGLIYGEDSWLFSSKHGSTSVLEVIFSSPVRIRKVRVGGRITAIDDRDADVVEIAERLGIEVISSTCVRYRFISVVRGDEEVKIWISKTADAGVTARFRYSGVGK